MPQRRPASITALGCLFVAAGVSAAEVGAGERIIDLALVRLYQMRGKRPNLPTERMSD